MTTYQDPPLQSRRSVRQSERDKSQAAVTSPASAEPLTYSTQGSSAPVPDYDAPSSRARRTPQPVNQADLNTSAPVLPASRPRDFSPEGRAAAGAAWTPQYGGPDAAAEGAVEYQTQQRGSGAGASAASVDSNSVFALHDPAASTIIPSALDSEDIGEHTMSRRELRALREAHGITSAIEGPDTPLAATQQAPAQSAPAQSPPSQQTPAAQPVPVQPAPDAVAGTAGTPFAAPSSRLDSALAEFDQLAANRPAPLPPASPPARGRRAAPASQVSVVTNPASAPAPPPAPTPAAGPTQIAPEALQSPLVSPPAAAPQPQPEIVPPEIVVAEIVAEPMVEASIVESVVVEPAIVETTIVQSGTVEPSTSTPPTGHWSTQAQLDDETQVNDSPVSRNIGNTSGAITTSALVLPSIPSHAFGSLASGGSMTTGSISLSEMFTATGAHPSQLDESDLDHLLDPGDHQVASTDSQPVRAIKAVSTHTSSRGVIQTVKPKGTRGLTALIIAATGMAVVVGALFIVLVATGQL